jgi:hypothetical protein
MKAKILDENDHKKQQLKNLTKMYLKVIEEPKVEVEPTVPRLSNLGRKSNLSKSPMATNKLPTQGGVFRKKNRLDDGQANVPTLIEGRQSNLIEPLSKRELQEMIPRTPSDSFINETKDDTVNTSSNTINTEQKDNIENNLKDNIREFSEAISRKRAHSERQLEIASLYTMTIYKTLDHIPTAHRPRNQDELSSEPDINNKLVFEYQKKIQELENEKSELISQISSQRTIADPWESKLPKADDCHTEIISALHHLKDVLNVFMEKRGEADVTLSSDTDPVETIYNLANLLINKTPQVEKVRESEDTVLEPKEIPNHLDFESQSEITLMEAYPNNSLCDDVQKNFGILLSKSESKRERVSYDEKMGFVDKVRMILESKREEEPLENKVLEESLESKVLEEPLEDKVLEEPLEDKVLEEPLEDKVLEDQKTQKISQGSSLESIADKSEVDMPIFKYEVTHCDPPSLPEYYRGQNINVGMLIEEVMNVKRQLRRIESSMRGISIPPVSIDELENVSFDISEMDASFKEPKYQIN